MESRLRTLLCRDLEAFVNLVIGELIEEAFAKEQWDKVVAGFNDLISACEVAEKFGCKGVCKGGGS